MHSTGLKLIALAKADGRLSDLLRCYDEAQAGLAALRAELARIEAKTAEVDRKLAEAKNQVKVLGRMRAQKILDGEDAEHSAQVKANAEAIEELSKYRVALAREARIVAKGPEAATATMVPRSGPGPLPLARDAVAAAELAIEQLLSEVAAKAHLEAVEIHGGHRTLVRCGQPPALAHADVMAALAADDAPLESADAPTD